MEYSFDHGVTWLAVADGYQFQTHMSEQGDEETEYHIPLPPTLGNAFRILSDREHREWDFSARFDFWVEESSLT